MGVFGQEERGKLMENNHQLPEPLPGYTTVTLWVILYSAAFYPEFTEQQHTCSEIPNLAILRYTSRSKQTFYLNKLFSTGTFKLMLGVILKCATTYVCYLLCV